MRILHLSTSDLSGGAFRGTYWLHLGLLQSGIDSNILVRRKLSNDFTVKEVHENIPLIEKIDRVKNSINIIHLSTYRNKGKTLFSPALTSSTGLHRAIKAIRPDVIHLHWINGNFVKPEDLSRFGIPVVWTLRDMWAFTGGCHYSGNCTKYVEDCGACPLLKSVSERDISRRLWLRKHRSWNDSKITLVAISSWLADCATRSSLFRGQNVRVIPNALDESRFRPLAKNFSRDALSLPQNKKIIAFGAINALHNKNKGFQYLAEALKKLASDGFSDSLELLVFGSSRPDEEPDLGVKVTYFGELHNDIMLSLVYSAADVMVVPSIQEAFGKTAIEAMACGTPVVSFDSTGLKDIVEHKLTGYRAKCFDVDDLAHGILWVCEDLQRHTSLAFAARRSVEERFTIKRQAESYHRLYLDLLST